MKNVILLISFCLLVNTGAAGIAKIKTIDASSAVKSVTVFSGHANVERVFKGKFEAGIYTLKFSHLPPTILDNSVRVSGKGTAAAKILNVKVTEKRLIGAFKKDIRELEKQREELTGQINALTDSNNGLSRRQQFLQLLTEKTTESISNLTDVQPPPLQNWENMLNFLENQLVGDFSKKREIDRKLNRLNEQVRIIDNKLGDNLNALGKAEKTVFIDLEVIKPGHLDVAASYIIPGAGWTPFFDLRLASSGKQANLTCSALVSQQTGEDWQDVGLTFSTARPLLVKRVPTLTPLIMGAPRRYSRAFYDNMETADGYSGRIHGIIVLPDGSAVPGVAVTLSSDIYGSKSTVTDEQGRFYFRRLLPGTYQVKCELEGFKTAISKGWRVYENKITKLNIQMETSAIKEEIVITGKTGAIDVRSTTKKYTFGSGSYPARSGGSSYSSSKKSKKTKRVIPTVEVVPKVKPVMEQTTAMKQREHSFSLSYSLKHKETIASNKTAQKATMFIENYDVEFEHVAVPRLSDHTFLKAAVKNSGETPLLGGRVNIFFDGTFVNTSKIDFVNPGDTFTLTVGADEAVTVKREPIKEVAGTSGVFKKKRKTHAGYTIHIKNFRKIPTKLRVIDQVPISHNEKIQVTDVTCTPGPLPKKEEEEAKETGIMEWLLELAPGESRRIKVAYDVLYPKGMTIAEQN